MIKHKEQRVGVFVDVGNMYHSAKNLYDANVNFKEVLKTAVAGRKLIRAVAYVVKSNSQEEQGFFEALSSQGFEVKMKELQVFTTGAKKGDWDVGLAIDAVKSADKLDVIILVTGDGDFIPLVLYLKENKGCQVEVIAFGKTSSSKLVEQADDFVDLEKNIESYLLRSRRGKHASAGHGREFRSRRGNLDELMPLKGAVHP
jgi:uncharacterized protein (TIGR00288 family)